VKVLIFFTLILLTEASLFAAEPNDILGIWNTDQGEAKVEIYMCGDKVCGKIIWLKNPIYTDSKEGEVGIPVIDRKNPDPALRSRPVIGVRILEGFISKGDNKWGEGTFYDPKSGHTYRGKMHLAAPDRLELRGYIGIPLFGQSSVWTR
jgi:uncharacterized protein (DUF2147 family)